jgi:hypothetical protein
MRSNKREKKEIKCCEALKVLKWTEKKENCWENLYYDNVICWWVIVSEESNGNMEKK